MKKLFYRSAALLLSAAALAPGLPAQSVPGGPGGGGPANRCAALRDAMAKHPAPNAAAEERRRKRLAECEAGKAPASDQADETAAGAQPGQGGSSDQGGQPQPGVPGEGGSSNSPPSSASAPVSMAAPASSAMGTIAGSPPSTLGRAAMPVGMAAVGPLFSTLEITVTTGDDDLRRDSLAWIDVRSPAGTQKCALKEGNASFDNNSTNPAKCGLTSPLTLNQLKATKLVLEYDGNPGAVLPTADDVVLAAGHDTDNWKVNAVHISAIAPGQPRQCLIDAKGNPLVELRGNSRIFELGGEC
jgi:hypothetical protein